MNSKYQDKYFNMNVNSTPTSNNMNSNNVAPAPVPGTLELPPWIFDVYDDDHIILDGINIDDNDITTLPTTNVTSNSRQQQRSLLDELGIDLHHHY